MGHLPVLKDSTILILRLLTGKFYLQFPWILPLVLKRADFFYPSRWRRNLQWEYEFSVWSTACMRWYVFCLSLLGSKKTHLLYLQYFFSWCIHTSFIYLFSLSYCSFLYSVHIIQHPIVLDPFSCFTKILIYVLLT